MFSSYTYCSFNHYVLIIYILQLLWFLYHQILQNVPHHGLYYIQHYVLHHIMSIVQHHVHKDFKRHHTSGAKSLQLLEWQNILILKFMWFFMILILPKSNCSYWRFYENIKRAYWKVFTKMSDISQKWNITVIPYLIARFILSRVEKTVHYSGS